jgi:hypothetical protein
MLDTNILPSVIEQGIGRCSKGVFATNAGAVGLLTGIGICSVIDLDSGSILILLELSVVTPVVLPPASCCGGGTAP